MKLLPTLVGFLLLAACSKDLPTPLPADEAINLSNLKAGQKSIYKRYTTNCGELSSNFEFRGDVMHLEVIEEAGQLYYSIECCNLLSI